MRISLESRLHPLRDRPHPLRDLLWGACGALVVLLIFVAAAVGIEPEEAEVATGVVLVLAALWLAHSWRALWRDERATRRERGRR
jgi:protein-S-isoprenylcysteine O-methyltransferase Ste14